MMKKVSTSNAPAAIGPYSQAIIAGETIYVSGQLGIDPKNGKFIDDTTEGQTKQILENIKAILSSAGSDLSKAVSTTVYLSDMEDFAKMNEVYAQFFKEPYPARATVAVKNLPKNGKVEISVIAVK